MPDDLISGDNLTAIANNLMEIKQSIQETFEVQYSFVVIVTICKSNPKTKMNGK